MKNFGLFQFMLAGGMALFISLPGGQLTLPEITFEKENSSFDDFLEKFPAAGLPYAIGMETLALQDLEQGDRPESSEGPLLEAEFGEFLPAIGDRAFSRMGPDDIHAEALIASTDDFHILAYSRKQHFSFYPGSYFLAVFSRSGKLIDELQFAYSYGRDGGLTGRIDELFFIEITEKEAVWAKNVKKFGYEDNQVTGYKNVNAEFFTLDKNGKFVEMDIKKEKPADNPVHLNDAKASISF